MEKKLAFPSTCTKTPTLKSWPVGRGNKVVAKKERRKKERRKKKEKERRKGKGWEGVEGNKQRTVTLPWPKIKEKSAMLKKFANRKEELSVFRVLNKATISSLSVPMKYKTNISVAQVTDFI